LCFYWRKKGYIVYYCFKCKNNEKGSANTTKVGDEGDNYAFMATRTSCYGSVIDRIVDSGATKYVPLHWQCFHSYENILTKNVILKYNTKLKVVDRDIIIVDIKVKGCVKTIKMKDAFYIL